MVVTIFALSLNTVLAYGLIFGHWGLPRLEVAGAAWAGESAIARVELSTDGDVLVVTPVRNRKRKKRTALLVAEAHEHYGGVFRRLAE